MFFKALEESRSGDNATSAKVLYLWASPRGTHGYHLELSITEAECTQSSTQQRNVHDNFTNRGTKDTDLLGPFLRESPAFIGKFSYKRVAFLLKDCVLFANHGPERSFFLKLC
jgi:hypothetical protein